MKNRASLLRNLTRFDCSVAIQFPFLAHTSAGSQLQTPDGQKRFAFAAVITESGAVIVRVFSDTAGVWSEQQYGCFETWTRAQNFAAVLNESYGIDPMEAQYIVVSASLAVQSSKQQL